MGNYKFFALTIIYLLLACLSSLCILVFRLFIRSADGVSTHFGFVRVVCLLLTLLICLLFTVFAGMHSVMHIWQMGRNLTSIEYHKFAQVKAMAAHFQIDFPDTHEFDDGLFGNAKSMLGWDVWFWCLPLAPALAEDGYKFKINAQNKKRIESVTQQIQEKRQQLWKSARLKGAQ